MAEPVKIVVVIEGGLVQAVLSAGIPVECVVIDYDTEGADLAELVDIPQDNGRTAKAFARAWDATIDGAFVLSAFKAAGEN